MDSNTDSPCCGWYWPGSSLGCTEPLEPPSPPGDMGVRGDLRGGRGGGGGRGDDGSGKEEKGGVGERERSGGARGC